jgi:RimJ/RimL family protein N-acetyltransferase
MRLIDVYSFNGPVVILFLYQMLKSRDPTVNISHKEMPTRQEHLRFFDSRPYQAWYIIEHEDEWFGNIYLTHANEIGIHILPVYEGNGYGKWAVQELMRQHGPRRYLANISPLNLPSQKFFRALEFKICQFTYELDHAQN